MEMDHPDLRSPYPQAQSCARFLPFVRPHVQDILIPEDSWRHVASMLGTLPAALAMNLFGFETSLGGEPGPVDFSVRLNRWMKGPEILSSLAGRSGTTEDPVRQACRRIASAWADLDTALGWCVDNIWLEFDLFSAHPGSPSLFFQIRSESVELFQKIYDDIRSCLGENAACTIKDPALHRCLASLDGCGLITWFGIMLPRPGAGFRLCVRIPGNTVSRFLGASGYPCPIGPVSNLFDRLKPLFHPMSLNVDIGETMGETVGFECFLGRDNPSPPWAEALDCLVEEGWCTPEKRDAVLNYRGRSHPGEGPGDWPDELLALGRTAKDRTDLESVYIRRVSHVKIKQRPGEDPGAKVYLSMEHRWGKAHKPGPS